MSDIAINQVLSQMRAMQAMARNESPISFETKAAAPFSELMSQSIDQVNNAMQDSKAIAARFETGDPSVSLAEVMINAQKASIQFSGMTEVRNKLLTAYKDVMNMPV
ncbi:MAG TPA: flagellar hook-basal body complex protein FliE [Halieaceae bacterium]|nr:flagellar hook-basal body complex protein FliE [Halieaceae bacterium]